MKYIPFLLAVLLLVGCAAPAMEVNAPQGEQPQVISRRAELPSQPLTEEELRQQTLQFLLNSMTTEERVGQLFLGRCPEDTAVEDLQSYHLAGFVLFSRDFQGQTPQTLEPLLKSYQQASHLPLLIAVDEEGGTVCRVSSVSAFRWAPFAAPRTLYAAGGMEAVLAAEEEKAALLSSLGIQVILGPVCDIAREPGAFMYRRSLGQDGTVTGEFVSATLLIYDRYHIGGVMKHFPGYGSNTDTHTGIARDDRTLEELEGLDLIPFRAGIASGCGAIMVSHTIITALDDTLPASLSPAVHSYLRRDMGYTGVILTDDLDMQGITQLYGPGEAAVLAVLAGNDLILCTDYAAGYTAVLEAVHSGRIPQQLLDQAVLRVLAWKDDLGILFA